MGTISPLDDNLTIGNYEIIEKLGGRSSGSVYRGLDPELGRAVVIRVLRENIAWTPGLEERFRRDYAPAASLNHPNIATVYEIGKEGAFPYVAMESIGPRNIKRLVEQRAELTVETKLSMLLQAAAGLGHAHKEGVLHLDLAPSKIHLLPDGTTKVRNFNLANLQDQYPPTMPDEPSLYAAPETAKGQVGSVQTDIYALGAVFYEFFTLHRPSRNAAGETQFPDLERVAEIPPGLWNILKSCLARNPDDRYRDMDDLAAAVKGLLESLVEDKRLMQTELSSAVEPLRRFASRPETPSDAALAAHKLLHEIQLLASGESEAHYALLERLLNQLIAQYPQYAHDAHDDPLNADDTQPLPEPVPEARETAEPAASAEPSELPEPSEEARPEETGNADSGAVAPSELPELPEQPAATAEEEKEEEPAQAEVSPEPETEPTPEPEKAEKDEARPEPPVAAQEATEAAPETTPEPVPEVTDAPDAPDAAATDGATPVAEPAAASQEQPAPAAGAGNRANFTPAEPETGLSNLDRLMDELIQTHPKLQDIDSNAEFDVYTPPWEAMPTAEPAAAPTAEAPATPPVPVAAPEAPKAPPVPTPLPSANAAAKPSLQASPAQPITEEQEQEKKERLSGMEQRAKSKNSAPTASYLDQLQEVTGKEQVREQVNQELSSSSSAVLPNPERRKTPRTAAPVVLEERKIREKKNPVPWKQIALVATVLVLLVVGLGLIIFNSSGTAKPEEAEKIEPPKEIEFSAPPLSPLETSLGQPQGSAEPEAAEGKAPEAAQAVAVPMDDDGRKQIAQVKKWIADNKFTAAADKLKKLERFYSGDPELRDLRKALNNAKKQAQDRELQSQRNQREEAMNQQASGFYAGGQYDQAETAVAKWLGENPSSAQAQRLDAAIKEVKKNKKAYESYLAQNRYPEAAAALRNIEQQNPGDPNLQVWKQQLNSRMSNARAYLTVSRLGAKGSLLVDGRAIGSNGAVKNMPIGIGPHTISVESGGRPVASQSIDFSEGQSWTLVYDVAQPALRPLREGDRERLSLLSQLEQGISFEVEHPHKFGKCSGTLKLTEDSISFSSLESKDGFAKPAGKVKIGKIDNETLELLDADSNKKFFGSLKFSDEQSLQRFRNIMKTAYGAK